MTVCFFEASLMDRLLRIALGPFASHYFRTACFALL